MTVLMPVRNGGRYLDAAVASILRQTYLDFEFIVVDDGSTDDTPEMLQRWQRSDARIRVLSGPQRGIGSALNQGLAEAHGSIIVRMDADDVAAPERIERQVAFLREHPEIAAVGSAIRYIDPSGKPSFTAKYPQAHGEALALLGSGNSPMAHPAVAMRRDVVLSLGGYRPLFDGAEDFDLWMRLTEHHQIANLPQTLLDYRIHDGRSSVDRRWEQALAAHIARFSFHARRKGLPDPTERATMLELSHLQQLKLDPADLSSVLSDLTSVALASFEKHGANAYLRHARDSLSALDDLSSWHMRRAVRTLIWYSWRAGEHRQAIEVAGWIARRRLSNLAASKAHKAPGRTGSSPLVNRWLVHCADPLGPHTPPPPRGLSPAQFQQLVEEADAHGVLPALMENLPDFARTPDYAETRKDGLARQRTGLSYSVLLGHYAGAIGTAAANLPVTTVKGRTFARLIYPAAKLRPFTDIDLLVAPSAVPAINAVLEDQRFRLAAHDYDPQREEAKWIHLDSPLLMVEVHTNLVHHPKLRASLSLAYDDIAEGPETPAALLTIALMHGALHRYERLRQVVDICQAARHLATQSDEAQFVRMMDRTGGRFAAVAGLDLAYRLFHEPRCREIAAALGSVRHRMLARMLVDQSTVLSTMNSSRLYHSWRRQTFRALLKRSRQF